MISRLNRKVNYEFDSFLESILQRTYSGEVGLNNDRLRQEWLEREILNIKEGSVVLDAGAGELNNKRYCKHLKYISQDFCEYDGQGDSVGLQTDIWDTSKIDIVCDIIDIPLDDDAIDAIICTEVLEHLPNPRAAIGELVRVLKPGGKLIITAPFCSMTHFSPYHYATGFNRYFYEDVFNELKVELQKCEASGNYFDYLAQEVRRLDYMTSTYTNMSFSGRLVSFFNAMIQRLYLKKLCLLSNNDKGSSELLCYGYHVIAVKSPALGTNPL